LGEASEQQAATSEILRVISSSPTDVQPVFDAIAENAARLVQAWSVTVLRWDGKLIHLVAEMGGLPGSGQVLRDESPWLPNTTSGTGRCIATGSVIHVPDVDLDPEADTAARELARQRGWRSDLNAPMLRDGAPIGAISVTRVEAGPFSAAEIELLKTFADQAVIAIENVRLFKELEARNRDLMATSEILRVISISPTDVQPVFGTIAQSAARLCEAFEASIFERDGDHLRLVAHHGPLPDRPDLVIPVIRGTVTGRCVLDRQVVSVADLQAAEDDFPQGVAFAREFGFRSFVSVPLLREGVAIGAIGVRRTEIQPFTDTQIALLQTFADQAVIAIENVRLFKELEARNGDLTRALDTQTATSDILRVISRSQTDAQPVFDAILASAVRLLGAYSGSLTRRAGDQIELVALTSTDDAGDAAVRARYPQPLQSEDFQARALRDRAPLNVADAHTDPRLPEGTRAYARARGWRSAVMVPMLRHDEAIGTISLTRGEPGGFTADEIALLQTFAEQAVIAIENVRLFKELEAANRELKAASQHKSEFLANMSHELRTPLNAIIGFSEVMSEGMFGELNEKQREYSQDIHASGQHLLSLINDILDLSKIEAGRMELELTEFHLPTAIENALTLVRERAGRRGTALETHVDERLGQVQADERKIRQVVLNLLSNAIKFTPEGGRIDVRAVPRDGIVEVSVSDTGVGIAPEDQGAIFEEFRQVGAAAKKVEGTGLGLALSRKFIELHGGRIWVESQVSAGSTFTFTIPMRTG
jgi:signal transduction histidine kinase